MMPSKPRILCALALLLLVAAWPASTGAQQGRGRAPSPGALAQASRDLALRHYLQGLLSEHSGDLEGAIEEVSRAFAADPTGADLALKLADLSLQAGNPSSALEYARRASALGDATGRSRLIAGSALASMGRVPEAMTEFERAAEADSGNVEAWLALGRAREEQEDIEGAALALRRARTLDPERTEIAWRLAGIEARLGRLAAADSLLDEVEQVQPGLPGIAVTRGWIADREGRFADAARAYERHLEQFPGDVRVRRQLLQTYARLDDPDKALAQAKELFEQAPADLDVARLLIALHLRGGRNDQAVEAARTLREATPGEIEAGAFAINVIGFAGSEAEARKEADRLTKEAARDYRAWIVAAETWASHEAEKGPEKEVERRYSEAERVMPDSTSAQVALARSYTRTNRHERAARMLEDALAREPRNGPLWLESAFALERQKKLPEAEAAARKALALEPRNAQTLNFLGYLFADANMKLDEAEPLIRRALEIDPQNPYYIDSLGWTLFRLGRLEDARAELERALDLSGGDPEIHAHLGDVLLALGRTAEAKVQYEKGLQLDPTSDALNRKLESLR
jgi:tetratricopeptide (TPR) repeat protein